MRLRIFNGHTESCLFLGFEYFDLLTVSLKKKSQCILVSSIANYCSVSLSVEIQLS